MLGKRQLPWGVILLVAMLPLFFLSCGDDGGSKREQEQPAVEPHFPLGQVRAVSYRTGDNEVYLDQRVWITLQGGYASHSNEQIVTSGLNNVGVGTYVYLQGKGEDEHGTQITGWSWRVVGPHEVEVAVDDATGQRARFLAGAEGEYDVDVSVTKEDGSQATDELIVYAGRYIGAENCALCHSGSVMPDKVTEWRQTGHATKFEDFFGSYSASRDYCIGCHTTGYNEVDDADGFDDAARQGGWTSDQGSFMEWVTLQNLTLDDIEDLPTGQFLNIQCESCHGPGSVHTGTLSYEPGVCSQCHPQEAQWRFSGHSGSGSNEMHMAESTGCAYCHTGQGFVEKSVRHNALVFPHEATAEKPANLPEPGGMAPIACATCHDPHAFTEPHEGNYGPASNQLRITGEVTMYNGVAKDAEESAICVTCHNDKRDLNYKADFLAGKNSRGPHDNTQADNYYAITSAAFDYGLGDYGTSPHPTLVEEGCIHCHMAEPPHAPEGAVVDGVIVVTSHGVNILNNIGGHTWNLSAAYEGTEVQNTGACMTEGCHADGSITTFNRTASGDYDGDGTVEGVQDEVQGLLDLLADRLPKDGNGNIPTSGIDKMKLNKAELQALWNYHLINNDGSLGVHNTAYAVQVLQRTYTQLTGQPVGTTPTPPVGPPPAIPHTLEGRDDCVLCHQVGADGVGQSGGLGMPADHAGRASDTCRGCHQPSA